MTVHGAASEHFARPVGSPPEVPIELGPHSEGFVLCPSGAEWRKNLDRMLEAWARIDRATRVRWPLVVQCHMDPDTWALGASQRRVGRRRRGDVHRSGQRGRSGGADAVGSAGGVPLAVRRARTAGVGGPPVRRAGGGGRQLLAPRAGSGRRCPLRRARRRVHRRDRRAAPGRRHPTRPAGSHAGGPALHLDRGGPIGGRGVPRAADAPVRTLRPTRRPDWPSPHPCRPSSRGRRPTWPRCSNTFRHMRRSRC